MISVGVMESKARLELSDRLDTLKKNSSGSSLGSLREDDITGSEEAVDPLSAKAIFYVYEDGLDESPDSGISSGSRGQTSSGGRRTRSHLLQLFSCQNCCKRRRSPRTSKNKAHSSSDPNSTSSSSLKIYQAGGIDSSNLLSVNSILTSRLSPSDDDDDDSDGVGSKKAPRRSEKSKRAGRRSPIEIPGLLTSILKHRHSPSPIRGDTATHPSKDTTQSSVTPGKHKAPPPIRIWQTEPSNNHTHLEPPEVNSVLARCARLKNQSLYGSFSFQKAELQKFNASLAVSVEAETADEDISSPGHRSVSESSSGSGSPFPWLFGNSCPNVSNKSSTGGKRARFNEAVDVIVDDQRSGKQFKNIVRLKPSDDSVLDTRGQQEGRLRLSSDSSDADFTLAALRCRRRQKAFGEARISIVPVSGRPVGKGRGGSSKRASVDKNCRQEAPMLRVAIRLKEDFTRDRVFVRTARGGTRLLVGTYRPEPLGDGTNYLRQFVDRYSLPHAIDVTTVVATLGADDSPDDLVITARLFDYESEDCE